MPTDPTRSPSADRQPPGDPRYAAMLTRCRRLRRELDRLDDALGLLSRDERDGLDTLAASIREAVDTFDAVVERRAAGQ